MVKPTYTREFDDAHYKKMVISFIKQYGSASRKDMRHSNPIKYAKCAKCAKWLVNHNCCGRENEHRKQV